MIPEVSFYEEDSESSEQDFSDRLKQPDRSSRPTEQPKAKIEVSFRRKEFDPPKQQSKWMAFEEGQCPWCLQKGFPKGPSLGQHQKLKCPMRIDFIDRQIWYCFSCNNGWKQRRYYDKHMLSHEESCEENQQSFDDWKIRENMAREEALKAMRLEKQEYLENRQPDLDSSSESDSEDEAPVMPLPRSTRCPWCKENLKDRELVMPHQVDQCPLRYDFLNNGYWACFMCSKFFLSQDEHDGHLVEHRTEFDTTEEYEHYLKSERRQVKLVQEILALKVVRKKLLAKATKDSEKEGPANSKSDTSNNFSTPQVSGSKRKSSSQTADQSPKKKRTSKSKGQVTRVPLGVLDENQ